ncbi:hypothetical protein GCM10011611_37370 [Aliidongia dinghuensis]|uniref:HTH araC/xylS-type domain-containing protein n=1 Tax=Aliidongia dinghuensis TaxID=1867774 RepID=A0A8J3E4J7_9PROT|nr:AraC family transcriptional regulator [Aliidongia dinghuensis]GGF27909.1 hypothetical protein GCM10011611_37370 [Aliidongia dinghuensis]
MLSVLLHDARVELLPAAPYDVGYTPEVPVIGFAFETQAGSHAFASDRVTPFRTRPNSLAYVPPGCDVLSRSGTGGEYLTIRLRSGAEEPDARSGHFNDHVDPVAIEAARRLRRLLLMRAAADPLELEREVAILQGAVLRAAGGPHGDKIDVAAARWMTPRRLRLIEELIEAHMEDGLSVAEMAACVGLSAGFFGRAFKAAAGVTPHDHLIERRIARARRLMATTSSGLAEIAAACGFASHAHLTAQLRRRLGVAPSALRQAAQNR